MEEFIDYDKMSRFFRPQGIICWDGACSPEIPLKRNP